MQNMTMKREGDLLYVTVDLSKPIGPSHTGKTIIYATSGGTKAVPGEGEFRIGLNVFSKEAKSRS